MLARLAASAENPKSADNEAAIEKYLRSVLAVENILTLDRLRQVTTYHTRTIYSSVSQTRSKVCSFSVLSQDYTAD